MQFHSNYIGIPIFFFLWLSYKLFFKTKVLRPDEVDLTSGLKAIYDEEKRFLEQQAAQGPRSRLIRIWDAL